MRTPLAVVLTGSLLAPSASVAQLTAAASPAARPGASAFVLRLPTLEERQHYLVDRLDGWHTMIGERSQLARDFLPEMAALKAKLGAVETPEQLTQWAYAVDSFETRLMDRLDPRLPYMEPEAARQARQTLLETKETLVALNRRRVGADPRTRAQIDSLKKEIKAAGLDASSLSGIFDRAHALAGGASAASMSLASLAGGALPVYASPISFAQAPMAERSYPAPSTPYRAHSANPMPEIGDGATAVAAPDNLDEQRVVEIARARGLNQNIVLQAFRESRRQGVDFRMTLAVIESESAFNPRATSPVGARGLMQIMPGTGQGLGVHNSGMLYDVATNIRAGVRYLKGLWEQFSDVAWSQLGSLNPFMRGDVKAAIAAYNAGPGAVQKYGGVPPYRETRNYVVTVLSNYRKYARIFSE